MISRRHFIKGIFGSLFISLFSSLLSRPNHFQALSSSEMSDKDNLLPKIDKLVTIHDEQATFWDYKAEKYLDYINQDVIDKMVDKGICELTGLESPINAWKKTMTGYVKGDKVAIKPNFNNVNHGYQECFTSPQVINSVIKALVDYLNVSEKEIYVYDLCKKCNGQVKTDTLF